MSIVHDSSEPISSFRVVPRFDDKVLIFKPRLDVPFKNLGPVPEERGPLSPIRQHWANWIRGLEDAHIKCGINSVTIEMPLWQFTPELVGTIAGEQNEKNRILAIYVPHRQRWQLSVPGFRTYYYMQTVFPERFTCDPDGWGAAMSISPIIPSSRPDEVILKNLRQRVENNQSKFDQPSSRRLNLPNQYLLFLCQIPHDETIRFFSTISVYDALVATLRLGKIFSMPVVVKGHPVNPESMSELKAETAKHDHAIWVDDVSIHDVIRGAHSVFMVNSGSAYEVMIHHKNLYCFGQSEYMVVVNKVDLTNLKTVFLTGDNRIDQYDGMLTAFWQHTTGSSVEEHVRRIEMVYG